MSEEVKGTSEIKAEIINDDVTVVCVLCGQSGHMGKDCKEVVCILCCAKGHLMEECGDIIIEESGGGDDVKAHNDVMVGEPTSGSTLHEPATIRLKNLNDLLNNDGGGDGKVVSLEEATTPQAVPTTFQEKSRKVADDEDDKKFQILMTRMFGKTTPPDVIALFKQKYCGLCCIKFSCEKFAKKHYDGRGHEALIRKKTFRNRPMSWQMVFHALISVDPEGATEDEIFEYICETFSAHLGHDLERVRDEMVATIRDMVDRFHNVIESAGVYRLRDRRPGDAPKPVPNGLLVDKKKCEEVVGDLKPNNSRYSGYQRQVDSRHKDWDIRRNRSEEEKFRPRARDLREDLDRERRYRRERVSRQERNRSRDGRRQVYKERSRSRSRSRDYRRSSHRRRSRSRHRRINSTISGAV